MNCNYCETKEMAEVVKIELKDGTESKHYWCSYCGSLFFETENKWRLPTSYRLMGASKATNFESHNKAEEGDKWIRF